MSSQKSMLNDLIGLCLENDVSSVSELENYAEADIFESGIMDSSGLVYMQAIIEQHYSVEIPYEMFVTELRSLAAIANYLRETINEIQECS